MKTIIWHMHFSNYLLRPSLSEPDIEYVIGMEYKELKGIYMIIC